jgi:site-specific DNA recombinase
MKIGIYARVSHRNQVEKGLSLEDQIRRGIEFCEKNNFNYEIFEDGGFSGDLSIQERPGLNKLFNQITNKKGKEIDGIFVTEWERLTRNEEEGFYIKSLIVDKKLKYFDVNGELNFNDATTSLIMGVKNLLSSFERKKVQERVKRNLETSVIKGHISGGPLIAYGYKKGENKMMVIDEIEADVIRLIFEKYIEGLGTKKIAELLKLYPQFAEKVETKNPIIENYVDERVEDLPIELEGHKAPFKTKNLTLMIS